MTNEKTIKGVLTLVPTSFDENGELDLKAFRENIDYLENTGMHGVVVASSAGEFYTLKEDEFRKLAATAREACQNMTCVINCSYQNARTTIGRVKYAEEIGADCAMVYPYHYMQVSDPSLYHEYFRVINEATNNIRFMIINDPRETKGMTITIDMYSKLLKDFPRIAAIVEDVVNASEPNLRTTSTIFLEAGKTASVLARSEAGMLPGMSLGGKGCLATYGLAIPKFLLRLYDECESKKYDEALKDCQTLIRYPWQNHAVGINVPGTASTLFPGTFTTLIGNTHMILPTKVGTIFPGTVTICKAMAEAAGRRVGNPRLPMLPLTKEIKEFARGWLEDIGNQ